MKSSEAKDIVNSLEAFRELLEGHNIAGFMQRAAGHLDAIHASNGPEEQKLLAKDKALIDLLSFMREYILSNESRMPPEVAWHSCLFGSVSGTSRVFLSS